MTISVGVADDQEPSRTRFCEIIDAADGLTLAGEATSGWDGVRLTRAVQPDVLLLDVRMADLDGVEATRIITNDRRSAGVRVIVTATFDLDEYVFGALHAGACGFLLKDVPPEDITTAIRVAVAGEALITPLRTRRLVSAMARTPTPGAVVSAAGPSADRTEQVATLLSEPEREVLGLVGAGLSNMEIAELLNISPAAARTQVAYLLTRLKAKDRIHLVMVAYAAGLAPAK